MSEMTFNRAKENSPTGETINMDGMFHSVGDLECCNFETCECGGIIHVQPIYGGIWYECDKCKEYY